MRRATLLMALIPVAALAQRPLTEQAVGKQPAQELETRSTIVTDPAIVQYVNRVAQKVALAAGLRDPLTVKVITGDSPQAEAFPRASCYIDTGLILTAASEAELAGAIAHQLGHLSLLHDDQQVRLDPQNTGQIPLIWYTGCVRWSARGLAIPTGLVNRQAPLESQADQLGLGYMDKGSYDPEALADLFERMLSQIRKPSVFQPWATFPVSTRTCADTLRDQRSDYLVTTSEFREIQRRLAAILPPPPVPGAVPTLHPGK
jgi:predicted Zn-dependent protease